MTLTIDPESQGDAPGSVGRKSDLDPATGEAVYLVRAGRRWLVPDGATARLLGAAHGGLRSADGTDVLAPVAGTLRSLDVSGLFRDEDDAHFYLDRGRLFRLRAADAGSFARLGAAAPLSSVLDPRDRHAVLASAVDLDLAADEADPWLALHEYLLTIPPPAVTEPSGLSIVQVSENTGPHTAAGGVEYEVTTAQRRITNVLERFPVVAPVNDTIWPGALVQGSSLASGLLAPIQIDDRFEGTVEVASELVVEHPDAPRAAVVARPTRRSVNEARRGILDGLRPISSAEGMKPEILTLHDEQQMSARLGASVKGTGWNASADASVSGSLDRSEVVVKLEQRFYTMTFTPSGSPARYFGDAVTPGDLGVFSGPGNAPCYISEIEYGRIFLMRISSETTTSSVSADVSAVWEAAVSGSVDLSAEVRSRSQAFQVSVASVGLTGSTAFATLGGLVDTVKALRDTADYTLDNPGTVISYTLRYLVDGSVARVVVGPTEYKAYVRADIPVEPYEYRVWDERGKGRPEGTPTGVVVRRGDTVTITAHGQVWAGWWLGNRFGPEGDTSPHGREINNDTKPLRDCPYSALLYGFGTGWVYWAAAPSFVYGETEWKLNQTEEKGRLIGSPATPLPLFVHICDDDVENGSGSFAGTIVVQRRPLAAVSDQ